MTLQRLLLASPMLLLAACGYSILGGGGPTGKEPYGTGGGVAASTATSGSGGAGSTAAGSSGATGSGGASSSSAAGSGGAGASGGGGPCGACAAGDVCNPVTTHCEPACDNPGGLQPGAAWPMVGGCPTRRGLSPFVGTQVANVKWSYAGSSGSETGGDIVIDAAGDIYASMLSNVLVLRPDGTLETTLPSIPFGAPAVGVDGTLYVPQWGTGIDAIDPSTGMVTWSAGAQAEQGVGVLIRGDRTIVSTAGDAVFATTPAGVVSWTAAVNGSFGLDCNPAVAPSGLTYEVGLSFFALNPDGTMAWTRTLQGYGGPTPAIAPDGNVYVGNGGHAYKFQPDGTLLWDVTLEDPPKQPQLAAISIAPDGSLFATGTVVGGSTLYHLAAADGSVAWRFPVPEMIAGKPVIDAHGNVFVALGGFVYAFHPDMTQLWVFSPVDSSGCAGLAIGSDGTVYTSCSGTVYALGP